MTITITADVTFRHGTQLYTADQSYDVADNLAHLFMVRKWASGTAAGSKSVTMAEDWREGATFYATGETYSIPQPLADFLIEIGLATANLPTALLDLIAAADENSWVQVNTNDFQDIWPASDYRPAFNAGVSNPASILRAWASYALDEDNHRLIFWGGGHANSNCNGVYVFDLTTLEWSLAFYPADIATVTGGMGIETVDWPSTAQSSHTYPTQLWLPKRQRFITFGGAANSSGGVFTIRGATSDDDRPVGCFTLDMTEAGTGKVAGTTGSNVQRNTTVGVTLDGAEAWAKRDWFLDHADPNGILTSLDNARTNSVSAYAEENGHDVVYYKRGAGNLYRFELVDGDYTNDILSIVGQGWTTSSSPMGGGLDTARNIFLALRSATSPFDGWDLASPGATNRNFTVAAAGLTGDDAAEFLTQMTDEANTLGMLYDTKRSRFVAWGRGGRVWSITPPDSDFTTGYAVAKLSDDTLITRPLTQSELGPQGSDPADSGVNGKFRYSAALDLYIGVQHTQDGNIWVHKPENWVDPR